MSKAFSLIEFLVVILILLILFGFACSGFSVLLDNHRNALERKRLFHAVLFARREAMLNQCEVSLCLSEDGLVCSADGVGLSYFVRSKKGLIKVFPASAVKAHWQWQGFGQESWVTFQADGRAQANGTFLYCQGECLSAIMVSKTGRVRLLS